MKKLFLIIALICFGGNAIASPYFRPLDISHLQPIAGALIDPWDIQASEMMGLLPLITHSVNNGCLLPMLVCEDWSPLAVGLSGTGGNVSLVIAPIANVLPALRALGLSVVPRSLPGLRNILSSADSAVTISGGPAFEYKSVDNKGYFRVFSGMQLHF